MASKAQFQAVLADYGAYLSGGNNALEQQNRIRDYLRSFSEDEYHLVLLQVLAFINRDVGWRYNRLNGEKVIPENQLARLVSDLYQYRGYGRRDYVASEGYSTFIHGDVLPTPGTALFQVFTWRTPDIIAAPNPGTFQHGDQSFNLVSTLAGNAVLVVPLNVASATVTVQRYIGTFAGQGNGNLTVGGNAMIGNILQTEVTGGTQISLNGTGGAVYDLIVVSFSDVRINRAPRLVDGLGKDITLMSRADPTTLAARVALMARVAANAPDIPTLFRRNELRATAPLWHCGKELLEIASAGRV
uniref:Uncharacterized protein n=1 Tax=viral metagenome TaxID=1070528 RepID=A0A2V0R9R4_9ZZZZ